MQIGFLDVFLSVLALCVLAIPGFIFGKLKLLPETASATCSSIVLYCCQSVMVFLSFQSYEFSPKIGLNMLYVFLLSVAVHFIMAGIMFLCIKGNADRQKCIRYAGVFSNCGFMGLPFLQMLFAGQEILGELLIYSAVILSVFNIINWTLGVYIMTGDKKEISIKKIVFNPVIISVVVGFLFFVILKKPITSLPKEGTVLYSLVEKLFASLKMISDMVTPLSMFVIGLRLSNVNLKELFLSGKAYISCAFKLVVMPLVTFLIMFFLPIDKTIKTTVFLLLAMPTATSTSLFAVMFKGDGDFSSVCVLLSTVLSIITIPVMSLMLQI